MAESDGPTMAGTVARGFVEGPAEELAPGTWAGDYRVIERLSSGGFGTVYRAERSVLAREVALKVLHRDLLRSPTALARFEREARAVNLIRHENVVDIFDFGQLPDGRPFLAMEYLEGEDLERRIARDGRLSAEATRRILEALCRALAAAHAKGIVHRDVKASNVFLARAGDGGERVVLLDFGIAHLSEGEGRGLTTSRHVLGTPSSMAPEQITGGAVDARADVYALGVLAHHMLCGALPWAGATPERVRELHLAAPRPRPSELAPVTGEVDALIARAMAIDPCGRPDDASAFLEEARTALAPASARRAQRGRGSALLIELRALDDVEVIDALLDRIDAVLAGVRRRLEALGWSAALDGPEELLMIRAVAEDARDQGGEAPVEVARRLWHELQPQLAGDPALMLSICVHQGDLLLDDTRARGGPLLHYASWAPRDRAAGVAVVEPDGSVRRLG